MGEARICEDCYALVDQTNHQAHRGLHQFDRSQVEQLRRVADEADQIARSAKREAGQALVDATTALQGMRNLALQLERPDDHGPDGWVCPECKATEFVLQLGGRRSGRIACASCGWCVREG